MREVDYTASVAFLRKFFAYTEGNVELRVIGNNNELGPRLFDRDPDKVLMFCQQNDRPGWAVYFGCATRIAGHRQGKRENLSEIICALIDIDTEKLGIATEDAVAVLQACPCPPSIIVHSGRGLHAYWLLREAADVRGWGADQDDAYSAVLKRLAACFAADACHDLPRVMRLPGTHNSKEGIWRQCRVLDDNEYRYELGDLAEMLDQLGGPLIVPLSGGKTAIIPPDGPDDPFLAYGVAMSLDIEAELAAMSLHDPQGKGVHRTRLRVAGSMVARGIPDEEIFDRLLEETAKAVAAGGERWDGRRERDESRKLRDEIKGAHDKGWAPKPDPKVVQLRPGQSEKPAPDPEGDPAPEFMGFPLNDLGNSMRMLGLYGQDMRYCVSAGWFLWDRRRFRYDPEGNRARRLAQATAVRMRLEAAKLPVASPAQEKRAAAIFKYAIGSGNKKGIDGMLSEAKPSDKHVITVGDLDADPMLLNCRNGTVDLKTGAFRPHSRDDLISKMAGADYDPAAACPQWEKFVSEIFDGKPEVIAFVQRALGYSLTGDCREEVIFILHGAGANGKTVLIETMAAAMGDYVKHSPADTWTASNQPQASHDLAALVGARFVPVVETEHGKQLAEAKIKQATGGDKITARHLYKEQFEYQPQFKLWFATNHRPKIRGGDHAIWRRVYLIPFLVRFVDQAQADDEGGRKVKDPELIGKLKKELPGILAWMVRGCLEWQRLKGLAPPDAVVVATRDYQESEDNISGFIADRCYARRVMSASIGLLYAGYLVWCEENEEEPQSKKAFGFSLTERGHFIDRKTKERLRKGIDLKETFKEAAGLRQAEEVAKPNKTPDTDGKPGG